MTGGRALALLVAVSVPATLAVAADDPGYEVVLAVRAAAAPGEHPTVSLSILPHAGYQLLADAPLLVRLRGDGVTPERALYRREDAVDPRAEAPRFELRFRRDRREAARLDADLTFYICKAKLCRPVEKTVSTNL